MTKTGSGDVPQFDEADLQRAIEAGRRRRASRLHAVSVQYLGERDAVEIRLDGDITMTFPRSRIDEFAGVTPELMQGLTVSPRGSGLELDAADVHVDVHGLLASLLSPGDMAKALAHHGRKTTSESQAEAARKNGQKGGRQRKQSEVLRVA